MVKDILAISKQGKEMEKERRGILVEINTLAITKKTRELEKVPTLGLVVEIMLVISLTAGGPEKVLIPILMAVYT